MTRRAIKVAQCAPLMHELFTSAHAELSQCLVSLFVESQDPEVRHDPRSKDLYTRYDALDAMETNHERIAATFFEHFERGFYQPEQDPGHPKLSSTDIQQPQIIDTDRLELDEAIQPFIHTLEQNFATPLLHLELRIESLNRKLNERKINPSFLHPETLLAAFEEGIHPLALRVQGKRLLCELFQQQLFVHLDALYTSLNDALIKGGILDQDNLIENAVRARELVTEEHDPEQQDDAGAEMAQLPGGDAVTDSAIDETDFIKLILDHDVPGTGSGLSSYQRSQIVAALSELQRTELHSKRVLSTEQIKSAVKRTLYHSGIFNAEEVVETEAHVIDFVSQIFQTILSDQTIPTPAKSVVGRLEMPAIKLALLDFEFFKDHTHPARELISHLATLAATNKNTRNPLYKKLDAIVDKILTRFDTDINVFRSPLEVLRKLAAEQAQKARHKEEQAQRQAQREARKAAAKDRVADTIKRHIGGKNPPRKVMAFIGECWAPYMALIYTEHGPQSAQWKESVYSVRLLIEASERKRTAEELDLLLGPTDAFIDELQATLSNSGLDKARWQRHVEKLRRWFHGFRHRLAQSHALGEELPLYETPVGEPQPGTVDEPDTAAKEPRSIIQHVVDRLADKEHTASPRPEGEIRTVTEFSKSVAKAAQGERKQQAEEDPMDHLLFDDDHGIDQQEAVEADDVSTDEKLFDDNHGIDELAAAEASQADNSPESNVKRLLSNLQKDVEADSPEPPIPKLPSEVKIGAWYEIFQAEGKAKRRLKLSAIVQDSQQALFANHAGDRELSIDLDTFLGDLRDGHSKPINDSNLFDRALSSVIANIRDAQEQRIPL